MSSERCIIEARAGHSSNLANIRMLCAPAIIHERIKNNQQTNKDLLAYVTSCHGKTAAKTKQFNMAVMWESHVKREGKGGLLRYHTCPATANLNPNAKVTQNKDLIPNLPVHTYMPSPPSVTPFPLKSVSCIKRAKMRFAHCFFLCSRRILV